MAKKTTTKVTKAQAPMPRKETIITPAPAPALTARKELQDHHKAFSHIMYALFLVSIAFAAYYTLNALGNLSAFKNSDAFFPVIAILMLLWSFLFWEFGHRIHTA